MNENCRHSKETHRFAPEPLAAAAVCLSDLLYSTTHIRQHLLVLLRIYRYKTRWEREAPHPCARLWTHISHGYLWVGFLGAASGWSDFLARGFGLVWESRFIFLSSLCFLSLYYLFPISAAAALSLLQVCRLHIRI